MKKILLPFILIGLLGGYNQTIAQNFTHFIPDGENYSSKNCPQITYDKINQKLWACTRGQNDTALVSFDGSNFNYFSNSANGIAIYGSSQNDIEVAPNGDIWINHFALIQKFDGSLCTDYTAANSGLINDFNNDMAITSTGEVYIGNSNGFGVSMFNGTSWTSSPNWSISGMNNVYHVLSIDYNDYDSSIWFSGHDKLYRLKNGVLTSWTHTNMGITGDGDILDITFDQNGNTWLAMHNDNNDPSAGGIIKYNGTNWTKYNTNNSNISTNRISKIDWDGKKLLMISYQSFETFDGINNWIKYDETNSNFPANYFAIRDVVAVDSNHCYIGTENGIILMSNTTANLEEHSNYLTISIFPNPTSNNQAISLKSTEMLYRVNIQSIDGKILFEQNNIQSKTLEIPSQNWAKGVYVVQQTNTQGQAFSQKLIIE